MGGALPQVRLYHMWPVGYKYPERLLLGRVVMHTRARTHMLRPSFTFRSHHPVWTQSAFSTKSESECCHSNQYLLISTWVQPWQTHTEFLFVFQVELLQLVYCYSLIPADCRERTDEEIWIFTRELMCFCCCWCRHQTRAELTVWRHDTLVFTSLISEAV